VIRWVVCQRCVNAYVDHFLLSRSTTCTTGAGSPAKIPKLWAKNCCGSYSFRVGYFHPGSGDLVIAIDVDGSEIYRGKAKYEEAQRLGVRGGGSTFHLDRMPGLRFGGALRFEPDVVRRYIDRTRL